MENTVNAPLDWNDIKKSAAQFVLKYKKVTKEASYKQLFWSDFFQMYGVDSIQVGAFEWYVKKLGNKGGEIDYFWPGKVVIEHKSAGKNLDAAIDQAMDYLLGLEKKEEWPRYIIVSDFKNIRVLDLKDHKDRTIKLEELPDNVELFGFLAGYSDKKIEGQHPVNIKAAEVMGELYDLLMESHYPKEDLDLLLIRLVFCMFAEDADVFEKNIFQSYLTFHTGDDGTGMGAALNEIFAVLNTPFDQRQSAMSAELQAFPYVNGGLFAKQITTPMFDRNMRDHFLKAAQLDWKYISPAIFGSLFQSIMDPSMRRELGAHYTSEENILKLIKPLFLDDLRAEFNTIKKNKKELRKFWDKIAAIRIMDPACGCGNFLIISYREMRLLEMDVLDALYEGQMIFDESHLFIDHYYGIEIGEFASMVANLSMILMDHLMNVEMRNRFGQCRDIIPLKEKANIICENSLRFDWINLIDPEKLTYIVGNPPFVGTAYQSLPQKEDMINIFENEGSFLDYVSAWYYKSAELMFHHPHIRTAFVSTNSIVQGEQAITLWKLLSEKFSIKLNFAHQTFVWNNEAKGVAKVHCIIAGFSNEKSESKIKHIYQSDDSILTVKSINQYLEPGVMAFIKKQTKPICVETPKMIMGSMAVDDGLLTFNQEELDSFIEKDPDAEKYIRPFMMGYEFINNVPRYCLWLKDIDLSELKTHPLIIERLGKIKDFREKSNRKQTKKAAETPYLFGEIRQPESDYIAVPKVSSQRRKYIPIGFIKSNVIAGDKIFIIPDGTLYHFGILSSSMHNAWMRTVGGRLKSDYSYSNTIVYNTFVWPTASESEKEEIENIAQEILNIREKYKDKSLAELYDPLISPKELIAIHEKLDKKVDALYSKKILKDDSERVECLFEMYSKLKILN